MPYSPAVELDMVRSALRAALPKVDVFDGDIPATPVRPYVVVTSSMPSVARRRVAGGAMQDVETVLVMSVNDSHDGTRWLGLECRRVLDGLLLSPHRRLRYAFASPPILSDEPGEYRYRWSTTSDFRFHTPRSCP